MKSNYRIPNVEEGIHNLILQNRCGSRLTAMFFADRTELEFVYKPNAYRRKEFAARNFSTRDNFTSLFASFVLPDVHADDVQQWQYDPFHTVLVTEAPCQAKNTIHLLNLADENVFAISAACPLLLAFRPRRAFDVRPGLLTENFADRGEEIVTVVHFPGFLENRFRILDDGTCVLQIMQEDVVLVGAEENSGQVARVVQKLSAMNLAALDRHNEAMLHPLLAKGKAKFRNRKFQQVFDLNRRIVLSGMDAGGACFGAINRIYHLIWTRDGSMTSCHMAQAGNPEFIKLWAPFLLTNPTFSRGKDGTLHPEFLQIVGTRWTKAEDDGLFYATWTLFQHFQSTGDDALLQGREFETLLQAVTHHLGDRYDPGRKLMGSDTIGESTLAANPFYGYDIVDGSLDPHRNPEGTDQQPVQRCFSLYHQINTYNVLMMIGVLLEQRPDLQDTGTAAYPKIAEALRKSVEKRFRGKDGCLLSHLMLMADGREEWTPFGTGCDYWEHAWAVSQGPFTMLPALQLATAKRIVETWRTFRPYGFCPWNVLSRKLFEHGMNSHDWEKMLADEMAEALLQTEKYPMPGALTEYVEGVEGWRGLPFSAGSFAAAAAAQLILALPQGLAVAAGSAVQSMENYRYRLSGIQIVASGNGAAVAGFLVNGSAVTGSLQIPEGMLKSGMNEIRIERCAAYRQPRIAGSNAVLAGLVAEKDGMTAQFTSAVELQIVVENLSVAKDFSVTDEKGKPIQCLRQELPGTNRTVLLATRQNGRVLVHWR